MNTAARFVHIAAVFEEAACRTATDGGIPYLQWYLHSSCGSVLYMPLYFP